MLSEHDLNIEIQNGRVFDPASVAKNAYKVQSSSIDLSVKKSIYLTVKTIIKPEKVTFFNRVKL